MNGYRCNDMDVIDDVPRPEMEAVPGTSGGYIRCIPIEKLQAPASDNSTCEVLDLRVPINISSESSSKSSGADDTMNRSHISISSDSEEDRDVKDESTMRGFCMCGRYLSKK